MDADPAPLYYSGGGQFYSPQLVRSVAETSQTEVPKKIGEAKCFYDYYQSCK
jgi:hypothetical protein